jgi:4-aminobutyrate aminotransferase-like enzyme
MKKLLQKEFGFNIVEILEINGYENTNYLIKTGKGKYIFKTYPFNYETFELIKAENDILLSLQDYKEKTFPKPVSFTDGALAKVIKLEGKESICRMLSFIEGDFLGDVKHSEKLFRSFGEFLARMDKALRTTVNYTIRARQWEWDIQYLNLNEKYLNEIPNAGDRNLVRYFFLQFKENVVHILPSLRKSIIHNDANEWNVLVRDGKVTGIIDFGDLAYSPLINELAIAITYACYDKKEPLEWASIILASYHKILPLEKKEIDILYYLIAARLSISVCNSAYLKKKYPDNKHITVSEKPAWKMLRRWLKINPVAAKNKFRTAAGFKTTDPVPVDNLIKRRRKTISQILSLTYSNPIYMVRSAFQYMYDAYGNTFLDAYNNIPHVGHSHPEVVAAGQRQMAKLNTNTRYLYDILPEYAEKLLSKFPESLNKVYFVNSGSAASDLAIRLATAHTGHKKIMVMEQGYHGHTMMATDISDYKFSNKKGQGQKDYIFKTPIPDTFRGKYTNDDGSAGKQYAREAIAQLQNRKSPVAAFISEPVVGCAGQVPLAKGYLKELYPAIRNQGGVCISDEVQTGFGRLGDHFWGYEAQEVVPDIVILGKPMGNGHPIGAVVTTDEIAESFAKGVEFFSSFGGNPVSCAIGLSVLNVIEEEKLQQNAKAVGDYYKSLFAGLRNEFACIGDVRGSGLFIGVEIVKDTNMEPDTELAAHIKNELRNNNILISTDGQYDNVLKTKPPLIFTKENAEQVVDTIRKILKKQEYGEGQLK